MKRITLITAAIVTAFGLAACQQRADDPTVGQKIDNAIEKADRQAEAAKQDAKEMAADAKNATADAMAKVGEGVSDIAITTSVNAELAKDKQLSALKIDVDTKNGHVQLSGKAPSTEARERATVLAAAIKGVVSVDNRLAIDARG